MKREVKRTVSGCWGVNGTRSVLGGRAPLRPWAVVDGSSSIPRGFTAWEDDANRPA